MRICKFEKWLEINEERIESITESYFNKLFKHYCHNKEHFLYKNIYNPYFERGIFKKSHKNIDPVYYTTTHKQNERIFPIRENSIVCQKEKEPSEGETFLVFPFKYSTFTIAPYDISENYRKGIWTDEIKWLERFGERTLWTDNYCLLIKENLCK